MKKLFVLATILLCQLNINAQIRQREIVEPKSPFSDISQSIKEHTAQENKKPYGFEQAFNALGDIKSMLSTTQQTRTSKDTLHQIKLAQRKVEELKAALEEVKHALQSNTEKR